ncbi:hypothetical protein A2960_00790 [Candidatus Gottesmanbacteria bacterium RIFCSPLOWO2_01_FULL_39_12b]|uniref:Glycosyltransferase RgtA/B/C/D-like domain-containing protein n=1 Tax=Candidatus Gottesmanbacteria bacterium RIFCSPLOWO2_01_FULL_39_12b TaxID=1798388 RepID=A0A1F6APS9_9BACT|nr:MAG: hypothetical protein A2960_00790 [Candidatus Gottesmanbacteria bacterium RIFCSPLOWO2_01_FULL_39_12b]
MIDIIILLVKIIAVLFFVGYGFTALLIPKNLRKDAIWFTPWVGTILIAVLSIIFNLAQIPVAKSAYFILACAGILFIASLIARKTLPFLTLEFLFTTLLVGFTLFFNLFPLLTKVGFPTTISLSNLDPLSYTPVGDFLINHTVLEGGTFEHYKPYLGATGDLLHAGFRWGSPILLSFFSYVFRLKSYQIYSTIITIFFTFSFPLVYILAKRLSQKHNMHILSFSFITFSLNATLLYMLYNVFYAQFIFTGIFILVVILFHAYISEEKKDLRNFNSYDLLIALALSAITTIYPEGLIFAILPLLVFGILSLLKDRNPIHGIYFLKILLLTLVINPITAGTAIGQNVKIITSSTQSSFIGWEHIPFASPLDMTGFYNLYHSKDLPVFLDIIFGFPIAVIWLLGIINLRKKLFILSLLLAWIPFYVSLRWIFPNFFSFHRAITYTLFLYSALFSIGMCFLFSLIKNKMIKFTIIVLFLFLSFRSAQRTLYQLYWHAQVVDKSLISLTQLNKKKDIIEPFFTSDVYLGEDNLWKRLWREYFLMDRDIVTLQNLVTEKDNVANIRLVLAEKNYLEREGKKLIYTNKIWENDYYQLGTITPMKRIDDLP